MNPKQKRYITVLFFGLVSSFIIALLRDVFSKTGTEVFKVLADSFTVPGAILVAVGGLLWVAGDGFFDMLAYGLKNGLHTLFPVYKMESRDFYEYKTSKMEKRKANKGIFVPFLVIGFAFLVISLAFAIAYAVI